MNYLQNSKYLYDGNPIFLTLLLESCDMSELQRMIDSQYMLKSTKEASDMQKFCTPQVSLIES